MAGSLSNALEIDFLKAMTGQATTILTTTPFAHVYVALFTGALVGDTPGTECTGGGYARVDSIGKWAVPSAGSVTSNATIDFVFSGSVSSGAAVTHIGLFDALTSGNALGYGDLTDQTKTYSTSDTARFVAGSLTITAD